MVPEDEGGCARWVKTPYEGVSICVLHHNNVEGGAAFLRLEAGARFPVHSHPGGEEAYVIRGSVAMGGEILRAGDFMWTPPGGVHDMTATVRSLVFVSTLNGIRLLE